MSAWTVEDIQQNHRGLTFSFGGLDPASTENAVACFAIPHAACTTRIERVEGEPMGVPICSATEMSELENALRVEVWDVRDIRILSASLPQSRLAKIPNAPPAVRVHIAVQFAHEEGWQPVAGEYREHEPYNQVWQALLNNPEQVAFLRARRVQNVSPSAFEQACNTMRASGRRPAIVELEEEGLCRTDLALLRGAGAVLETSDEASLRVWCEGLPVPSVLLSDDRSVSPPTTGLLFYAEHPETAYVRRRAYWITWGGEHGPRIADATMEMPANASLPPVTTAHALASIRQDSKLVNSLFMVQGVDAWADGVLSINEGALYKREIALPDLIPDTTATLEMDLVVESGIGPQLRVVVNGTVVHEATHTRSREMARIVALLPPVILNPDTNHIQLELVSPRELDRIAVLGLRVRYERRLAYRQGPLRFTLADSHIPAATCQISAFPSERCEIIELRPHTLRWTPRLEQTSTGLAGPLGSAPGAEVVVLQPSDCVVPNSVRLAMFVLPHQPTIQADYLVIGPRAFQPGMEPLMAVRRGGGLATRFVATEDIWETFGFGMPSAQALKMFLSQVVNQAESPVPSYLVLVGDSNWDSWDRNRNNYPVLVPTRDSGGTEPVPLEPWFVNRDDRTCLPEMMLGRLPVSTQDDLKAVVAKTCRWETMTRPGLWCARRVVALDNAIHVGEAADPTLSRQMSSRTLQIEDFGYEQLTSFAWREKPLRSSLEYTRALLDEIDAGVALLEYFGHGGVGNWSPHRLLLAMNRPDSDVRRLRPTDRYPVVLNWSCLTARFNQPPPMFERCVAEEFVLHADRGAIAFWGDAGYGHTSAHQRLSNRFHEAMLVKRLNQVGAAAVYASLAGSLWDSVSSSARRMALIGDPAARLYVPQEDLVLDTTKATDVNGNPQLHVAVHWPDAPVACLLEIGFTNPRGVVIDQRFAGQSEGRWAIRLDLPACNDLLTLVAVASSSDRSRVAVAQAPVDLTRSRASITFLEPLQKEDHIVIRAVGQNTTGASVLSLHAQTKHSVAGASSSEATVGLDVPVADVAGATITATLYELAPPDGWGRMITQDTRRLALGTTNKGTIPLLLPPSNQLVPARLVVAETPVQVRPAAPIRGQTIRFTVTVSNLGGRAAGPGNRLEVIDGATGRLLESESNEKTAPKIVWPAVPALEPGETTSLTIRWDPFERVGDVTCTVRISGPDAVPDATAPLAIAIRHSFADAITYAEAAYQSGDFAAGKRWDEHATQVMREEFESAETMAQQAHYRVLFRYVLACMRLGQWSRAGAVLDQIVHSYPSQPFLPYLLDSALLMAGERLSGDDVAAYLALRGHNEHAAYTNHEVMGLGAQKVLREGHAARAADLYREACRAFPLNLDHWQGRLAALSALREVTEQADAVAEQAERLGAVFLQWSQWQNAPNWWIYEQQGLTAGAVEQLDRLSRQLPWVNSLPAGVALGYAQLGDVQRALAVLSPATIASATTFWRAEMLALQGILLVQQGHYREGRARLVDALNLDPQTVVRKARPATFYGDDLVKSVNAPSIRCTVSTRTSWEWDYQAPLFADKQVPWRPWGAQWRALVPCWWQVRFPTRARLARVDVVPANQRIREIELVVPAPEDDDVLLPTWSTLRWGNRPDRFSVDLPDIRASSLRVRITKGFAENNTAYLSDVQIFARPVSPGERGEMPIDPRVDALHDNPRNTRLWEKTLAALHSESATEEEVAIVYDQVQSLREDFLSWAKWADNPGWRVYTVQGINENSIAALVAAASAAPWATSLPQGVALGHALLGDFHQARLVLADSVIAAATTFWQAEMHALRGIVALLTDDPETGQAELLRALALDSDVVVRKIKPFSFYGDDLAKYKNAPEIRCHVSERSPWEWEIDAPLLDNKYVSWRTFATAWRTPLPAWWQLELPGPVPITTVEIVPANTWIKALEVMVPAPAPDKVSIFWTETQASDQATRFKFAPPGVCASSLRVRITRGYEENDMGYLQDVGLFIQGEACVSDQAE